ncbi:hypothetical protein GCM10011309_22000 [Litorimonas cladophorae]|uniref:Trypsin-like peptidase domain-containing protein n=2 Tax=Litorimonas cladophorae TaxID=1220491 RepID=A0A918KR46_9PROT|nr:hypothetical protein GCM10011309_22000 [Litorimonas cladophorae]
MIAWGGALLLLTSAPMSWAQTSIKDVPVTYNKLYQLEDAYTIIYDNLTETAKLHAFQIEFFGPDGEILATTDIERFPLGARIQGFSLRDPIVGFQKVQLSVISLHAGDIGDMPSSISSALALNEQNEVVVPVIENRAPLARDGSFEFEASTMPIRGQISGLYSDPDGDALRATQSATVTPDLAATLDADGGFTLNRPSVTGSFDLPYVVTDPQNATAEATVTINLTLPDAIKFALEDASFAADKTRLNIQDKMDFHIANTSTEDAILSRLNILISETQVLSRASEVSKIPELKAEIDRLSSAMATAKTQAAALTFTQNLTAAENEVTTLKTQITELQRESEASGVNITVMADAISQTRQALENIEQTTQTLSPPEPITLSQIEAWEAEHATLRSQLPSTFGTRFWIAIAGLLIFAAVVLKFVMSSKAKKIAIQTTEQLTRTRLGLKRVAPAGVVFPASPLLATHVSAPLTASAKLTASQLQSLTGPYSVLREGYLATGRIGFAQVGVPSAEDYSFGTGFLISDRHVLTNRHVFGLYGHYLMSENDPGGIEFIAEKGSNHSDFVPFDGTPPRLIPSLDIAIFTLARPVTNRKPIAFKPIEADDLDTREIIVIGYPDTHTPNDPEILSVVEDDPVFAVKRISQGQIFRHSTDTDTPFGVRASVSIDDDTSFTMPAICHNASTLGGNSGSPLLDIRTGDLLGVHFAGFKVFNQKEAANLAMAVQQLTEHQDILSLNA